MRAGCGANVRHRVDTRGAGRPAGPGFTRALPRAVRRRLRADAAAAITGSACVPIHTRRYSLPLLLPRRSAAWRLRQRWRPLPRTPKYRTRCTARATARARLVAASTTEPARRSATRRNSGFPYRQEVPQAQAELNISTYWCPITRSIRPRSRYRNKRLSFGNRYVVQRHSVDERRLGRVSVAPCQSQ
jgi:hypothetical protein